MSMFSPGMTTADTFKGEPSAFKRAVFLNGFDTILRTGRCETAIGAQKRGDKPLIDFDQG